MELPIGKLASDLIEEIEKAVKGREADIKSYQDNINGIKYFVVKIQEFAAANTPTAEVVPDDSN